MDRTHIRILHLEDDPTDVELQNEFLKAEGYAVESRRVDTREGLSAALSQDSFDLILADNSMPGFDGLSALRIAQQISPGTPFIFVSGTIGEEVAIESLKNGATDYVLKYRLARLAPVVKRALHEAQERRKREQAEKDLRRSETRFRSLVENAMDEVSIVDGEGILLYESPTSNPTLGYSPGEFQGQNLFQLVHPEDVAHVRSQFERLKQNPALHPREQFRMRRRDGTWRWIEAVGTNLLGEPAVEGIVINYHDITKRKEAEEQIRYQALLLENVSDVIVSTNLEGNIRSWNKAAEKTLGYTAAEVIGAFADEIVQTEYINASRMEALNRLLEQGHWEGEVRVRNRFGRIFHTLASATVIRDSQGDPIGLLSINHDITDRKQAENALRETNQKLQVILDASPIPILSVDAQGRIQTWNKAAEHLFGWAASEVVGRVNPLVPTGESDEYLAMVGRTMQGESFIQLKRNRRKKDGSILDASISAAPQRDANGQVVGVTILIEDITERRRAEQALLESEENFRSLIENASDLITVIDQNGNVEYHSPASERILGYGPEQMVGQNLFAHIHPQDVQTLQSAILSAIREPGRSVSVEARIRHQDGSWRTLESVGKTYRRRDGALTNVITSRDITERKQAEEQLQQLNAVLEQRVSERTMEVSRVNMELERSLRVKDEFLAGMSHELRTPLNAIIGLSESLEEQVAGPLNEKQSRYVHTISESGHHLLSLINDILDLAKIESGQLAINRQNVDIRTLCQASLRIINHLALKKGQEVGLQIDDRLDVIIADERRLKQMLVNLLGNAIKFTPENGKIGLEVKGNRQEGTVTFTVWDTGIGIKEEDLERLFQPFVQLSSDLARKESGTGLGLALVSQMARLHGGRVDVESFPGKGSRFSFVLPWDTSLSPNDDPILTRTGRFRAVQPGSEQPKPTILLVEDTQDVVMVVKDYLEYSGYNVEVAASGIEGIRKANQIHPELILMDIQMPDMNGLEAAQLLRNDPVFQGTSIIALTALAMKGDREHLLSVGFDEYISKPIDLKALVKTVQEFLPAKGGHGNQ